MAGNFLDLPAAPSSTGEWVFGLGTRTKRRSPLSSFRHGGSGIVGSGFIESETDCLES